MLLQQPTDEFGDTAAEAVQNIVFNTTFQHALMACIVELVSFAATGQLCFPALTARLNALGCIMAMWEALLYVQHTLLKVRQVIVLVVCCCGLFAMVSSIASVPMDVEFTDAGCGSP